MPISEMRTGPAGANAGPEIKPREEWRGLEQTQDGLLRLIGETEADGAELLSGLQLQHIRAFLVLVGLHQLVGALRQHIGESLGVVEARGDDVQVVVERRGRGS